MTDLHKMTGAEIAPAISFVEYQRLLQIPRSHEMEGAILERAEGARDWYRNHGAPFVASVRTEISEIAAPSIRLTNRVELSSRRLAQRLRSGEAHALMVLLASAGTEVAEEVARHWAEERPDEAFFLDRFAVAVTEHLVHTASRLLCRSSQPHDETLLPHLSPGCGNWDIADQHKLMALLAEDSNRIGPVELLPSGALHPQHSILAAMGVTHMTFDTTPKDICRSCDLAGCNFRRAPMDP